MAIGWEPLKGGLPLAALVAGLILAKGVKGVARDESEDEQGKQDDAARREHARFAGITSSLRGGTSAAVPSYSGDQGNRGDSGLMGDSYFFDKDAAEHAYDAGAFLAKQAGIGGGLKAVASPLVKAITPGWKTKALTGAGVLGTGYLMAKAVKGTLRSGMSPEPPRAYGGLAAPLPNYVNQYGRPMLE